MGSPGASSPPCHSSSPWGDARSVSSLIAGSSAAAFGSQSIGAEQCGMQLSDSVHVHGNVGAVLQNELSGSREDGLGPRVGAFSDDRRRDGGARLDSGDEGRVSVAGDAGEIEEGELMNLCREAVACGSCPIRAENHPPLHCRVAARGISACNIIRV